MVLAYIAAFAMPPIGFVLGVVVAFRPGRTASRHAALIIVLSIIAAGIWILIITSGALSATNDSY